MKKIVWSVTVLMMIVLMCGCGKRTVDLERLHQIEGPLIEITHMGAGEMTEEEFAASVSTISVSYSGLAFIPNPINAEGVEMRDEDFKRVYNFCLDAYEKDKFANYKEDVCDGSTYSFTYYDEEGEAHRLYSGYIYGNKELNEIIQIIANYSID